MPHTFTYRLFFQRQKHSADIHRNVGLVRLVMIRQRRMHAAPATAATQTKCQLASVSNHLPDFEMQQASYHMAPRALS